MTKYLVVIEKADADFSVYVPDVPGCVSTGKTIEEAKANIKEALLSHFAEMKEDGEPIPEPQALGENVEIEVAPMSVSDEVRAYTYRHYIEPARQRGQQIVKVRAKEVHDALGLKNRYPLVCGALATQLFEQRYNVRRQQIEGPTQGTTTTFSFEIDPAQPHLVKNSPADSFEAARAFFEQHRDELLKDYEGKSIAIIAGKVVDSDVDRIALAHRVYEKYGYKAIYMPKVERTRRVVQIPTPFLRR